MDRLQKEERVRKEKKERERKRKKERKKAAWGEIEGDGDEWKELGVAKTLHHRPQLARHPFTPEHRHGSPCTLTSLSLLLSLCLSIYRQASTVRCSFPTLGRSVFPSRETFFSEIFLLSLSEERRSLPSLSCSCLTSCFTFLLRCCPPARA